MGFTRGIKSRSEIYRQRGKVCHDGARGSFCMLMLRRRKILLSRQIDEIEKGTISIFRRKRVLDMNRTTATGVVLRLSKTS